MVSGLVTSPCDQLRIFSGEARLMRIASKSATGFARSNGLERNKVYPPLLLSKAVASFEWPAASFPVPLLPRAMSRGTVFNIYSLLRQRRWPVCRLLKTGHRQLLLICCRAHHRLLVVCLDQLNLEAKRLQLGDKHVE